MSYDNNLVKNKQFICDGCHNIRCTANCPEKPKKCLITNEQIPAWIELTQN